MSSGYAFVIHRASQLDEDLVAKSIQLLQRIIELESEIKRSELDEDTKGKVIKLLNKLKNEILEEIQGARNPGNLYKGDIQVIE